LTVVKSTVKNNASLGAEVSGILYGQSPITFRKALQRVPRVCLLPFSLIKNVASSISPRGAFKQKKWRAILAPRAQAAARGAFAFCGGTSDWRISERIAL
jgi:hypothetical protein